MAPHNPFRFKTTSELLEKIKVLDVPVQLSDDLGVLEEPLAINGVSFPNRIVIHPMEGCDASAAGIPSDLTRRRYRRFGRSGAGLIWYEATAVCPEGRANPRQLMLNENTKDEFRKLIQIAETEEERLRGQHKALGKSVKILQITHSGRYARPGKKFPKRMYYFDALDNAYHQTRSDGDVLTDEYLDSLPEMYENTARLAKEVGFDGVDIKACHRYLLNESLSAFNRDGSRYGGAAYEDRSRLLKTIVKRVAQKTASPNFLISTRLNIYDAIPYPYGFGVVKEEYPEVDTYSAQSQLPRPDLKETVQLIKDLGEGINGVKLVNLTLANPYFNSYVSRPHDVPPKGLKKPIEHPLEGVARFLNLSRLLRQQLPSDIKLIGTGYSWLRQFGSNVAAAEIASGNIDLVGWGRMAFANPEFGQQIFLKGGIDPKQVCLTCSKCTELMRKDTVSGCVIRDKEIYYPYLKKGL